MVSTPPISQDLSEAPKEFLNTKPGWENKEGPVEFLHHHFTTTKQTTNFIKNEEPSAQLKIAWRHPHWSRRSGPALPRC